MDVSKQAQEAMILGQPVFGPDAPKERLLGRQISIGLAWFEVMGQDAAKLRQSIELPGFSTAQLHPGRRELMRLSNVRREQENRYSHLQITGRRLY